MTHARADTKWIASNATSAFAEPDDAPWHLARKVELRGYVSGRPMGFHYVTECGGRQLGGPWGHREATEVPERGQRCSRCAKLAAKEGVT